MGCAAVDCCIVDGWVDHGLPMSSGDGGYLTATPPPYYTAKLTYATSITTPRPPKNYTTELSAPAYYTDALKYYAALSYYQTEAPVYFTKATEYYTTTKG
jgi:hypothetical protein